MDWDQDYHLKITRLTNSQIASELAAVVILINMFSHWG